MKTPERRHWRRSGVYVVNFEHISHLVLVFLLSTLNLVITGWENLRYLAIKVADAL